MDRSSKQNSFRLLFSLIRHRSKCPRSSKQFMASLWQLPAILYAMAYFSFFLFYSRSVFRVELPSLHRFACALSLFEHSTDFHATISIVRVFLSLIHPAQHLPTTFLRKRFQSHRSDNFPTSVCLIFPPTIIR